MPGTPEAKPVTGLWKSERSWHYVWRLTMWTVVLSLTVRVKELSGFGRKIACQLCVVTKAWLIYDLIWAAWQCCISTRPGAQHEFIKEPETQKTPSLLALCRFSGEQVSRAQEGLASLYPQCLFPLKVPASKLHHIRILGVRVHNHSAQSILYFYITKMHVFLTWKLR